MRKLAGLLALLRRSASHGQGQRAKAASILAAAKSARDDGRWQDAAALYDQHTNLRPRRMGTWLQLGNMRRQIGLLDLAEDAYRRALVIRDTVEARAQLGYVLLLQGRVSEAIESFEAGLALAPGSPIARAGLIASGARHRLPESMLLESGAIDRLKSVIRETRLLIDDLADQAVVPIEWYGEFCRKNPLQPSPSLPDQDITVVVDGRVAAPALVRSTLMSLIDQNYDRWTAKVIVGPQIDDHPVLSMSHTDPRIRFADRMVDDLDQEGLIVPLVAGVVLRSSGLQWLAFALKRADVDVVYADHDHITDRWGSDRDFSDPAFQACPDVDDMRSTPTPPVLMAWRVATPRGEGSVSAIFESGTDRSLLLNAIAGRRAAHLPLVLGSIMHTSPDAAGGMPAPGDGVAGYLEPRQASANVGYSFKQTPSVLRVIIPTRDEPEMLAACINSLFATADHPEMVRVTVVDNRSERHETRTFLAEGLASSKFAVMVVDEPFNWARLNNLAVAETDEEHLLFLNNDTRILSSGWDKRLSSHLARPDIGIVGARLLYPDLTLQHGAVVMGMGSGTPRHEGRGTTQNQGGPANRWRRSRSVSAVTGAFLAITRKNFLNIGGLDELRFPIAYNDIDLCLACRLRDLRILYCAEIEVIHLESKTRGHNDTKARLAWDSGELTSLKQKWQEALLIDPAVNPHWATVSAMPFDGVRSVSSDEALRWLDLSHQPPSAWLRR